MTQRATMLVFKEGIDPERIKKWIEKLDELEVLDSARTEEFDPDHAFPVLYFP